MGGWEPQDARDARDAPDAQDAREVCVARPAPYRETVRAAEDGVQPPCTPSSRAESDGPAATIRNAPVSTGYWDTLRRCDPELRA